MTVRALTYTQARVRAMTEAYTLVHTGARDSKEK